MSGLFPEDEILILPQQPKLTTELVPSSHTIYAVLGYLMEYVGRYIDEDESNDLVEHFFTNEIKEALIFEKYLLRLIKEYQFENNLRSIVADKHTYFYSKELTHFINSYYLKYHLTGTDKNGNPAYTKGQGFFVENAGCISIDVFPQDDIEAKFSFLIGAHQRYGQKNLNMYQFANSHHKAKLVYQLLQDVGSPNVVFVYSPPDCAPCIYNVAFEPTPELIQRMDLRLHG
jgi:hypothetical protein